MSRAALKLCSTNAISHASHHDYTFSTRPLHSEPKITVRPMGALRRIWRESLMSAPSTYRALFSTPAPCYGHPWRALENSLELRYDWVDSPIFPHVFECFRGVRGAVVRCCIRIHMAHSRAQATAKQWHQRAYQDVVTNFQWRCVRVGEARFPVGKADAESMWRHSSSHQLITHSGWMGRRGQRIRPHYLFTFVFMVFYSSSAAMRLNVYKKHLSPSESIPFGWIRANNKTYACIRNIHVSRNRSSWQFTQRR